jgi:hypothetical protein
MNRTFIILASLVSLFFTSCTEPKAHWLIGEWTIDVEETREAFPLNNQLEDLLIEALTSNVASISITEDTLTTTHHEGDPLIHRYELKSQPTEEQIELVLDNGQTRTYYQKDGKIWYVTPGNLPMQLFLVER